jgi:hypothetical protein
VSEPAAEPAFLGPISSPKALSRAVAYLHGCDPAVSGQGGHNQTFKVACHVLSFGLTEDEAYHLLATVYNPRCQPPWSEQELRHKVASARKDGRAADKGPDEHGNKDHPLGRPQPPADEAEPDEGQPAGDGAGADDRPEGQPEDRPPRKSAAARAVELVTGKGVRLFHDPEGDAYVDIPLPGGARQTLRLRFSGFRIWLKYEYYKAEGKMLGSQALEIVVVVHDHPVIDGVILDARPPIVGGRRAASMRPPPIVGSEEGQRRAGPQRLRDQPP